MTAETAEPAVPAAVALPPEIRRALIDHARAEYPNEACGIVVGSAVAAAGGVARRFVATRNAAASPYRYEIDRHDLLRVSLEADDGDEAIWAIFHSHTHTPARPSPTDIALAFYPEALYLLVSLDPAEADTSTGEPSVRCWRILEGRVSEVGLGVSSIDAAAAAPEAASDVARPAATEPVIAPASAETPR